ncbi:hypothetical protein AWV80_38035 [Cupriavidus sp. UYMU48A]|nr:hypothetical protein AWV80_38035 [Cupriavidus sp. UYMU48A]
MTASKVKAATDAQQKTFGIVKPTVTVHVTKQKLRSAGVVHLKNYQDDLDQYEADFVMVDNVPVVLQRYFSNAKNEYTILVDSAKALEQGKDPWVVSDTLLEALHVSKEKVVWENEELRKFLKKQAKARLIVGKTTQAISFTGKGKKVVTVLDATSTARVKSAAKKIASTAATKKTKAGVVHQKRAAAGKAKSKSTSI